MTFPPFRYAVALSRSFFMPKYQPASLQDKIKKLTELVAQLSKLALKIIELLTYATVIELSVKTMIELWK